MQLQNGWTLRRRASPALAVSCAAPPGVIERVATTLAVTYAPPHSVIKYLTLTTKAEYTWPLTDCDEALMSAVGQQPVSVGIDTPCHELPILVLGVFLWNVCPSTTGGSRNSVLQCELTAADELHDTALRNLCLSTRMEM